MRARSAVLGLLFACCSAAAADPTEILRNAALAISTAEAQLGNREIKSVHLDEQVEAITALIHSGRLNLAGVSIARHYRGRARMLVNMARVRNGEPPDKEAAQLALDDYQVVLDNGIRPGLVRVGRERGL